MLTPRTSYFLRGLQLCGLCALAIGQPFLEPLADGPDFFVEHGATGLDVVLFALGFVLLPPLMLFALEALVGLANARAGEWLHLVFVGGLIAVVTWQALTQAEAAPRAANAVGLAVGLAAAALYARAEAVRSFLTVLSVSPLVVLALFLVFSPLRALIFGGDGEEPVPGAPGRAPVVMVVLDELPTASLLDARGRIDARRYPSFARLAQESTWYRNAMTVSDYTQLAVPAILTGRRPRHGALQVAAEYPRSLFTLLGGRWRVDAFEALTDLCRAACPDQRQGPFGRRMREMVAAALDRIPALPSPVRLRLADATRPGGAPTPDSQPTDESVRRHLVASENTRFATFLHTVRPGGDRPPFHFLHLLLPHGPWRYLPSGRRYDSVRVPPSARRGRGPRDPRALELAWQRHLLQVQFTDRLLGRLVRRLRTTDLWRRSLVVVTADHGTAFLPGEEARIASRANLSEVAPVPLFVKAPGQRRGRVDRRPFESTDIVPEMARLLGVRVPWKVDGRAAPAIPSRAVHTLQRQKDGASLTTSRRALERGALAAARRRLDAFLEGDPFAIGPSPRLRGRRAVGLPGAFPARVVLDDPSRFDHVDPRARRLPVDVSGVVRSRPPSRRALAIAVNGLVAATAWTLRAGGVEYFSALVPPAALRRGRNRVRVLELRNR